MILLVDDDRSVTASLALLLGREGFEVAEAGSPAEATKIMESNEVDLVVQDMNFSRDTTGEEGLALLRSIKERSSGLPVVLMTAWGSIELAVSGMKAGAADFVTKPWSNEQLLKTVETALDLAASRAQTGTPDRDALDAAFDFSAIVGRDPKLVKILDLVGRVAPTDASVLITGESGTGKELLAEAVHRNSKRRDGPFVKVNLGGISSTLFESEMFGHVRGAFTDARRSREGRFAVAGGGSIFLDEIGEVDRNAQVKLLRVLQDRSFEVLGSSRPERADVRVISATNRDLSVMVGEGSFREDLLYRLNLISIELPPLRDRPEDIPLLASHFAERCGESYGRPGLSLTPTALAWLQDQRWPGNIRQLRQVIERAVLVGPNASDGRLEAEDLDSLTETAPAVETALPAAGEMTLEELERAMIKKALDRSAATSPKPQRRSGSAGPPSTDVVRSSASNLTPAESPSSSRSFSGREPPHQSHPLHRPDPRAVRDRGGAGSVEDRSWLFVIEGIFALSIVLSIRLVRAFFVPLELIGTGAELIAERDFTSHFQPVGQPEMDELIGVYNRMIDQLREERLKVREQHELLDRILEASPAGILIADVSGHIVELNPSAERLLGITREDVLGRAPAELRSPLTEALLELRIGESRVVALSGGRRVRVTRATFHDQGFERSFYLLEELTEELRRSEKAAYGKLIRMMSHEVNNSVGAVNSLLGSIGAGIESLPPEERGDFDRAIRIATGRLENLRAFVDGFANVVRLPRPVPRLCEVGPLLADVLDLFEPSLTERNIELVRTGALALPPVALDQNQFEQVLVNILKNAAEAIEGPGTITVRTDLLGDQGTISIEDSGPGIPDAVRDELFTPFFTTKKEGCGLGLTLVREVLDGHGFPFSLENGEQGGLFRIELRAR